MKVVLKKIIRNTIASKYVVSDCNLKVFLWPALRNRFMSYVAGGRFKKEVVIDGQSYLLLIRDEGGPPEMQVSVKWVMGAGGGTDRPEMQVSIKWVVGEEGGAGPPEMQGSMKWVVGEGGGAVLPRCRSVWSEWWVREAVRVLPRCRSVWSGW